MPQGRGLKSNLSWWGLARRTRRRPKSRRPVAAPRLRRRRSLQWSGRRPRRRPAGPEIAAEATNAPAMFRRRSSGRSPTCGRVSRTRPTAPSQGLAAEHACDTPGDLRRLVEAAIRMAARVQRDRHHAVDVVMQSQRMDRPGKQRAQDPANRQMATVLEQLDEVIHRKGVGERGQAPLDRARTLEQHLRIRRQGRLAASAQVEAWSLARPAAQHAARREQPPADSVESPVNLKSSHWLTVARGALNTAGDRVAEHPRSARRRQPAIPNAKRRIHDVAQGPGPPRRSPHRLDAGRGARRCSRCRSTTCSSTRSGCTAAASTRTACR